MPRLFITRVLGFPSLCATPTFILHEAPRLSPGLGATDPLQRAGSRRRGRPKRGCDPVLLPAPVLEAVGGTQAPRPSAAPAVGWGKDPGVRAQLLLLPPSLPPTWRRRAGYRNPPMPGSVSRKCLRPPLCHYWSSPYPTRRPIGPWGRHSGLLPPSPHRASQANSEPRGWANGEARGWRRRPGSKRGLHWAGEPGRGGAGDGELRGRQDGGGDRGAAQAEGAGGVGGSGLAQGNPCLKLVRDPFVCVVSGGGRQRGEDEDTLERVQGRAAFTSLRGGMELGWPQWWQMAEGGS